LIAHTESCYVAASCSFPHQDFAADIFLSMFSLSGAFSCSREGESA
jgi:hypothetical protein